MKKPRSKNIIFVALLSIITLASGAEEISSLSYTKSCREMSSTYEIVDCLHSQLADHNNRLTLYLEKSIERYSDYPEITESLLKAQSAWVQYRDTHCSAVYEMWKGGTLRGIMANNCMIDLTRDRTHQLWSEYLTYMDSADPVLPEPEH